VINVAAEGYFGQEGIKNKKDDENENMYVV
jgi:hypothetical protein